MTVAIYCTVLALAYVALCVHAYRRDRRRGPR